MLSSVIGDGFVIMFLEDGMHCFVTGIGGVAIVVDDL